MNSTPAIPPQEPPRPSIAASIDYANIGLWQVLVVDDEPDNREIISLALGFSGATVVEAGNGRECIDKLATFAANMVLLDLSMPVLDGWKTQTELRNDPRHRHLPIIALTAHAMIGDEEKVLSAGFDGYLTKPVSIATLANQIKRILVAWQASHKSAETPSVEASASKPIGGDIASTGPTTSSSTPPPPSSAPSAQQ
jgi:CheY-like chemotaxis protein